MALDEKAGQRRSISINRNFAPTVDIPTPILGTISSSAPAVDLEIIKSPSALSKPAGASSKDLSVSTHRRAGQEPQARRRFYKMSFYTTDELRERFRIARLKGGFETIEDGHNRAIEIFCEMVESGKLSNF